VRGAPGLRAPLLSPAPLGLELGTLADEDGVLAGRHGQHGDPEHRLAGPGAKFSARRSAREGPSAPGLRARRSSWWPPPCCSAALGEIVRQAALAGEHLLGRAAGGRGSCALQLWQARVFEQLVQLSQAPNPRASGQMPAAKARDVTLDAALSSAARLRLWRPTPRTQVLSLDPPVLSGLGVE
jgi:hypothetical protein